MTERASPAAGSVDVLESESARGSFADEIIDELVPREIDWRSIVSSYPKTSVTVVAAAGFWLGRSRGRAILGALTGLAAETVNESINELFGRNVL